MLLRGLLGSGLLIVGGPATPAHGRPAARLSAPIALAAEGGGAANPPGPVDPGPAQPHDAAPGSAGRTARPTLVERLAQYPDALRRGPTGGLDAIFDVPLAEARPVFFPVSRARPLPYDYAPADLARDFGHPLRALLGADLAELLTAAERAGAYPQVVSGYRSAEYQYGLYEAAVRRQLVREPGIERAEAERRAARFVAPPGRSQHQLGTTADVSSWEIGYAVGAGFAETAAGRWLAEHAWEHGFILPYTLAAEARTGYVPEPWHLRWVGRPLAAFLWAQRYPDSPAPTADDWMTAVEQLIDANDGTAVIRSYPNFAT